MFVLGTKSSVCFRALLICTGTLLTPVYVYRLVVTLANQMSFSQSSGYLPVILPLSINKNPLFSIEAPLPQTVSYFILFLFPQCAPLACGYFFVLLREAQE